MYTAFEKLENGDLKISLTREGYQFLKANRQDGHFNYNSDSMFWKLIEDQIVQNGWRFVDADIPTNVISDDYTEDEKGNITKYGKAYAFEHFPKAVVHELWEYNHCIFKEISTISYWER